MADDFDTFIVKLRADARSIDRQVLDVTTALAFEAVRGTVLLTPVDTGRARANWQVTLDTPATGFNDRARDKTGSKTIEAGVATVERAKPYQPIWMHNGVPYITYLEHGTEKMSPRAMVARTMERLRAMKL
jgi:hypothetical protein